MEAKLVPHGQLMVTACIRCRSRAALWEMRDRDDKPMAIGEGGAVPVFCDDCRRLADADALVSFGFHPTWHRLTFPTAEEIANVASR